MLIDRYWIEFTTDPPDVRRKWSPTMFHGSPAEMTEEEARVLFQSQIDLIRSNPGALSPRTFWFRLRHETIEVLETEEVTRESASAN